MLLQLLEEGWRCVQVVEPQLLPNGLPLVVEVQGLALIAPGVRGVEAKCGS